ncbi:MAG TPA: hypothetical protein PLP66_13160 [Phycisphaerae bacterium]|jgi:hypothetical protein|nr:hypothetical protein [Phycisphaerae bacterium]HPM24851.1 hypothetical protein [Phycisphaerae bacterium]
MRHRHTRVLSWLVAAVAVGTCYGFGGCSLSDVGHYVANINPCLTILACDPVEYRFITSGYKGPGADPDIDPACTFPPYCDGDPFVSTGGGGA